LHGSVGAAAGPETGIQLIAFDLRGHISQIALLGGFDIGQRNIVLARRRGFIFHPFAHLPAHEEGYFFDGLFRLWGLLHGSIPCFYDYSPAGAALFKKNHNHPTGFINR
jgi:hypothetical protein